MMTSELRSHYIVPNYKSFIANLLKKYTCNTFLGSFFYILNKSFTNQKKYFAFYTFEIRLNYQISSFQKQK